MRIKHLYIMISALALVLSSCQQDDYDYDIQPQGVMSFNVVTPNSTTRVADEAFEAEDKVGIYVTDYIDDATPAPLQISGNRANNKYMVYDGTKWNTESVIYWGAGKADVYAYYPYFENVEDIDEHPFSVATDQNVYEDFEASDFLWAKAEGVAQSGGAVSLNMQHRMSRLVVKIMAGEDYVGSLPTDATVYLHSTVTDARISLATGSAVKYQYGGAHSIKMRSLGLRSFADGDAVVFEAIVVPQMLERSVPLLEINSKSVSYLLEDSFNFKPGVSYTYTAILNTSTTAIKVDIGCGTDDWNNMGGGSGDGSGSGSEGGEDDGIDLSTYTDLSAEGTANCYLVKAAGKYKFKAVLGNSDWSVGNVKKTEVLWETFGTDVMPNVGDLIASTGYKNGYVYFSTPETFKNGNASIAARNSKDLILWSWHIWCSEEGWNDHVYANNAGTMMDRNLGATSATPGDIGAFGLLYQWGRKDPFLGGCSSTENILSKSTGKWAVVSGEQTIDYAEANPTTFINSNNYDWCKGVGHGDYTKRWLESEKAVYDPCPVGYRVPSKDVWTTALLGTTWQKDTKYDWGNKGIYWALPNSTAAWYPGVGYLIADKYYTGGIMDVGTYYWSTSLYQNESRMAYTMCFTYLSYASSYNMIIPTNRDSYIANPVRCIKE